MGRADFLRLGSWNAICDRCGAKFKAEDLHLTWQGYRVCLRDWEPRQPQDFVRGVPERIAPPWTRPPAGEGGTPVGEPLYLDGSWTLNGAEELDGVRNIPLFTTRDFSS